MAAQSIGIFTIDFPDPASGNEKDNGQFTTLPANNSFRYPIPDNIQTLSPKDADRSNDPYGLLYVPDLASDSCKSDELTYVPQNATRMSNLPAEEFQYALIAIAPWFDAECIVQYFEAARKLPTKAFITWLPSRGNSMPPVMNDQAWFLGDGGSWKVANTFPTYAVSTTTGDNIAKALAIYSGNITNAPNGEDILSGNPDFRVTDYLRLWSTVSTESGNELPSLWVFLVIVLGLLVVVIGATSLAMHLIQRRRRNNLRQRIINGEVDLEALGVKRLHVPRSFLEKMPLYTYSAPTDSEEAEKTLAPTPAQTQETPTPTPTTQPQSGQPDIVNPAPPTETSFSQSSCSICLDDFEPGESQIRELPCHHIYHAECIDPFLLNNSSLCPLCKRSVLPAGQCLIKITNSLVRRERLISRAGNHRRGRARQTATQAQPQSSDVPPRLQAGFSSMGSRIGGAFAGRRIFSDGAQGRTQQAPDIEMVAGTSPPGSQPPVPASAPPPAQVSSQTNGTQLSQPAMQNRSDWVRERAMALMGDRDIPDEDEDDERNASRWKRGLRKVFPGFR